MFVIASAYRRRVYLFCKNKPWWQAHAQSEFFCQVQVSEGDDGSFPLVIRLFTPLVSGESVFVLTRLTYGYASLGHSSMSWEPFKPKKKR